MKFESAIVHGKDWKILSSETHYRDAHLSVRTEEVQTPAGGKRRRWTVVHRKAAVVIAPMTAEGKLVLIRQERIPIRAAIWEVPAGQIDLAAEGDVVARGEVRVEDAMAPQPESGVNAPGYNSALGYDTAALRELREETGYVLSKGGEIVPLGYFFSSPGFTDEQGYFFLARPVELGTNGPAHAESESILDCRAFGPEEIADMIAHGEIRDANTLAICAKLVARSFLSLHA